VRLSSAVVFDEVRGLATVDERRRLAREIHDGIAQELVYFGYELDAALAALPAKPDEACETLTRLRASNTETLNELRLSVYELRSEVDGARGLTAALSDHVRRLGSSTDLTVHLTLTDSGGRLNVATEAEVLRIAQEALSNARRHSGGRNLWVELIVDPPLVSLRVEDDGTGIDPAADPGFGLAIMRERSERLGAEFTVRPRRPNGTIVALLLRGR
jgi:signal transduction histidine kinase